MYASTPDQGVIVGKGVGVFVAVNVGEGRLVLVGTLVFVGVGVFVWVVVTVGVLVRVAVIVGVLVKPIGVGEEVLVGVNEAVDPGIVGVDVRAGSGVGVSVLDIDTGPI